MFTHYSERGFCDRKPTVCGLSDRDMLYLLLVFVTKVSVTQRVQVLVSIDSRNVLPLFGGKPFVELMLTFDKYPPPTKKKYFANRPASLEKVELKILYGFPFQIALDLIEIKKDLSHNGDR